MMTTTNHRIYIFSLWLKVIIAVFEGLCGLAIYFVTIKEIRLITKWILSWHIFADPHDRRTEVMQVALAGLPIDSKTFISVYLLLHGALKIGLVIGLLAEKRWAYPVGLFGLGAFVVYQLWHYYLHHHTTLLVLAVFDIFIMWMVWREWREKYGSG